MGAFRCKRKGETYPGCRLARNGQDGLLRASSLAVAALGIGARAQEHHQHRPRAADRVAQMPFEGRVDCYARYQSFPLMK